MSVYSGTWMYESKKSRFVPKAPSLRVSKSDAALVAVSLTIGLSTIAYEYAMLSAGWPTVRILAVIFLGLVADLMLLAPFIKR